jgi:Domain of unknown function (DUF4365)
MPTAPAPASLGMARPAQQERYADAFLQAVAATAGCALARPEVDDDSIDWTLSCRLLPRRPKIDIQMKSTALDDGLGTGIRYPLRKKNYDELITSNVIVPRLLVLVIVPDNLADWVSLSPTELLLRRCAYWLSLVGQPASTNLQSVSVSVPRSNVFDVAALQELVRRINVGLPL